LSTEHKVQDEYKFAVTTLKVFQFGAICTVFYRKTSIETLKYAYSLVWRTFIRELLIGEMGLFTGVLWP